MLLSWNANQSYGSCRERRICVPGSRAPTRCGNCVNCALRIGEVGMLSLWNPVIGVTALSSIGGRITKFVPPTGPIRRVGGPGSIFGGDSVPAGWISSSSIVGTWEFVSGLSEISLVDTKDPWGFGCTTEVVLPPAGLFNRDGRAPDTNAWITRRLRLNSSTSCASPRRRVRTSQVCFVNHCEYTPGRSLQTLQDSACETESIWT